MLDTAAGVYVCMLFVIYVLLYMLQAEFYLCMNEGKIIVSCYSVDRHIQRYMPGQDCRAYIKPDRVPYVFWTGSDGQYQFVNAEAAISLRFHFEMSAYAPV
jgi:hypothetical protein